jgi:hypothetical protein
MIAHGFTGNGWNWQGGERVGIIRTDLVLFLSVSLH